MQEHRIKIGEGGRVVIPAIYRKAIGINPGDELVILVQDGELRLFQQKQALKRIRKAVSKTKHKSSYVDDFLFVRRKDSGE